MKTTIKIEVETDIKFLKVQAGVRYWEDATVNDVPDENGTLIPCRNGYCWCPVIDIDSGIITNWKPGVKADIHYKVCDSGLYELESSEGKILLKRDGYVPNFMCPSENGYGDYIIMSVDENGKIKNWKFDSKSLQSFEED